MDDDEAVNATARKMLEHLGFEVDIAYDGETALTLYDQSRARRAPATTWSSST